MARSPVPLRLPRWERSPGTGSFERTYGLSDEGIKGWPEINANAYRCAIEDAQSALRERADELTDETGEQ